MKPERPVSSGAARPVDGEQYKTCALCGQDYDAFDFAQHAHHNATPHMPLSEPETPANRIRASGGSGGEGAALSASERSGD